MSFAEVIKQVRRAPTACGPLVAFVSRACAAGMPGPEARSRGSLPQAAGLAAQGAPRPAWTPCPNVVPGPPTSRRRVQVQSMDYDCIVFDTAPTGHTLRLLQFPSTLEKGLGKLMALKQSFGGMLNMVASLLGPGQGQIIEQASQKLGELKVGPGMLAPLGEGVLGLMAGSGGGGRPGAGGRRRARRSAGPRPRDGEPP